MARLPFPRGAAPSQVIAGGGGGVKDKSGSALVQRVTPVFGRAKSATGGLPASGMRLRYAPTYTCGAILCSNPKHHLHLQRHLCSAPKRHLYRKRILLSHAPDRPQSVHSCTYVRTSALHNRRSASCGVQRHSAARSDSVRESPRRTTSSPRRSLGASSTKADCMPTSRTRRRAPLIRQTPGR